MAQIAIPLLLFGTAYLVCNDENTEEEKESFSTIEESKNARILNPVYQNDFYPNISETKNNVNNQESLSSHKDKYFVRNTKVENGSNEFKTLAGEKMLYKDVKHNNMNIFYNNKSNGHDIMEYDNVLDNYTGQGTFDIKKEEVGSFFKPCSNNGFINGAPNVNNFLQSRVNTSLKQSNTKPFESIRDTPGIGMNYDEKSSLGFNTEAMNREMWQPKSVDDLRAANNPKLSYKLDDHMGPAMQKVQNRGIQGEIVKRRPEGFFVNHQNLGMVAGTTSAKQTTNRPNVNLGDQNRDTTTVSYYGARGAGEQNASYVNGEYQEAHKQQLPNAPFMNFSKNNMNPTNESNYGKESYSSLPNNRSTTRSNYFGGVGQMVSNVVTPIVNGLRHTKKTNFVKNKDAMGNVSGTNTKPTVSNPYQHLPTTNREMYEGKLNMNHINVQSTESNGYLVSNPYLEQTNRMTMNQSESGPAKSIGAQGLKSYQNVYNQRNNDKVHAENVQSGGSIDLFNSNISMRTTDKESCNDRQTPFYNPQPLNYGHASEIIGESSFKVQEYKNINNDNLDSSLLSAFKNNPYTQSLSSVA